MLTLGRFRLCCLLSLILAFFFVAGGTGQAKRHPGVPVDPRILISAVDMSRQTVTFSYKREKRDDIYTVDPQTIVTVLGTPGTLKNIRVGLQVVGYVERAPHVLDSVDLKTAEPSPAAFGK